MREIANCFNESCLFYQHWKLLFQLLSIFAYLKTTHSKCFFTPVSEQSFDEKYSGDFDETPDIN